MTTTLIITRDDNLLDELLRLAAAAGVTPEVAPDQVAALRSWSAAALVLVGSDLAAEVARARPLRRTGVHVVALGAVPDDLFRTALAVGAESVVGLPSSEEWLVESLTDAGDDQPVRGRTIGVVGGSGGAGATTFACALGQVAARSGPTLVVDLDPLGPGADRVLGLEALEGVRWDELGHTTGRLSGRSLREAVPRRNGLGVLTWEPGPHRDLSAFAVREAVSAAQRGHETVVLDLPRRRDDVLDEVVARCDRVLVVVAPTVSGVSSAARVCHGFADRAALRLVLRGGGADPADVARVVGVPVLAAMTDQRGLAEALDLGLGPVRSRRGPLGRASTTVLGQLAA